jgi:hypothetical protein
MKREREREMITETKKRRKWAVLRVWGVVVSGVAAGGAVGQDGLWSS